MVCTKFKSDVDQGGSARRLNMLIPSQSTRMSELMSPCRIYKFEILVPSSFYMLTSLSA